MPKRKHSEQEKQTDDVKLSKTECSIATNDSIIETNIDRSSKCWLQLLPAEVLVYIYNFLSLRDLISIEKLKCGRISELTQKASDADFSSYNDISSEEFEQFFTTYRVRHIQKIVFNSVFFVNTSFFVKTILRCKHLVSLTVIDCDVTFGNIHSILSQCKQIKELYWNVLAVVGEENDRLVFNDLQIRKLYLYIDCPKSSELAFYLLKNCQHLTKACLNFTPLHFPHFPLKTYQKNIAYKLHSNPGCPVSVIMDNFYELNESLLECIMYTKWCSCSDPDGPLQLEMTLPCLQLVTKEEQFPSLSSLSEDSVEELIIYCCHDNFFGQKMPEIKRVVGEHLKYLSVKTMQVTANLNKSLPSLLSHCYNIQVLLLSNLHFTDDLKLEAFHCLKGLKTLGLPSCVFKTERIFGSYQNNLEPENFDEFVKNVKCVEHFSLIKCESCSRGPKDIELSSISKWSNLKTLSLIRVPNLLFCHFLRAIAEDCPNFKSLEITANQEILVCHYIMNVIHLLNHAPRLMQLGITLDVLCVQNHRFWNAIASAKNIQSLCFIWLAHAPVCIQSITDAIEMLPLLHRFHLKSNCYTGGLAERVEKIMKRHGVKNPKVETSCYPRSFSDCYGSHCYIE